MVDPRSCINLSTGKISILRRRPRQWRPSLLTLMVSTTTTTAIAFQSSILLIGQSVHRNRNGRNGHGIELDRSMNRSCTAYSGLGCRGSSEGWRVAEGLRRRLRPRSQDQQCGRLKRELRENGKLFSSTVGPGISRAQHEDNDRTRCTQQFLLWCGDGSEG